ncbi:MAG: hypothetical protein RLZZ455_984 [Candidatus Parcubacteria bacterium]|jgi:hypothetical protein
MDLTKEEDEILDNLARILFEMAEKELQEEDAIKSSKTPKTSKKYSQIRSKV